MDQSLPIDQPWALVLRNLGLRLGKENDLSDVTWAIARTIPAFARWLCAFFEVAIAEDEPVEPEREYQLGKYGRVDLAFLSPRRIVLVENKIWDREYHLTEYANGLSTTTKNGRLGLISNHPLSVVDRKRARDVGVVVREWSQLVRALDKECPPELLPFRDGYLAYVKEVCAMKPVGVVRLAEETLRSLGYFDVMLKRVISSAGHGEFEYNIYSTTRPTWGPSWFGQYYSVTRPGFKAAYPWFGVVVTEAGLSLWIELEADWNPAATISSARALSGMRGESYQAETHDGGVCFIMLEDRYRQVMAAPDVAAQEEMVAGFFVEANRQIESLIPAE